MKIKKVLLSEIKGSVYQPRSQPDLELKNLVNSIIENGLITPIIVRETGKGLFPDAEFWCARLLRDEEVEPSEVQFDTMEEEMMKHKTISSWIDNKKLRMIKSKEGERVIFNVASVDEFLEIVRTIQKILE